MMLKGRATAEATAIYASRFPPRLPGNFRPGTRSVGFIHRNRNISSASLTMRPIRAYEEAIKESLRVWDQSDRHGGETTALPSASERNIGKAIGRDGHGGRDRGASRWSSRPRAVTSHSTVRSARRIRGRGSKGSITVKTGSCRLRCWLTGIALHDTEEYIGAMLELSRQESQSSKRSTSITSTIPRLQLRSDRAQGVPRTHSRPLFELPAVGGGE